MSGNIGYLVADNANSGGPDWSLDRASFKDHVQVKVTGTSSVLQRRRQYVITMSRRVFGVTSVRPENDERKTAFSLYTGPSTQWGFTWIGGNRYFICTLDELQILDKKTGEAIHTQQWEHFSKWENIPNTEFGE
jgi:hypothetical protein